MVDFFVIGAQKCGTQSAVHHIQNHKDIQISTSEIHFFDNKNVYNDFNKYNNFFGVKVKKLLGEVTPSYSYLRYSIDKIHQYNPKAKLILLIREPISRAFSQWNMYKQLNMINDDFIPSLEKIKNIKLNEIDSRGYHAIQRGYYYEQIKYILTIFNKEQLHISVSEKIKKDPINEYNKIFDFLGVGRFETIKFNDNIHKRNYNRKITQNEIEYLKPIYENHNKKLYDFLGYQIEEWEI